MKNQLLVQSGASHFYIEVEEKTGAQNIAASSAMSLDGVRNTVEAIATELSAAWDKVKPSEATVEFGIKAIAKSGKLTGLIVEGGGEATLNVKLTWKKSD